MITVTFYTAQKVINSFRVSGHSGYSDEGSDIVCAAVSSAVILTANTITEIMRIDADVTESDGFVSLKLAQNEAEKASSVLEGLKLHLLGLSVQYSKFLKVKISEV